LREPYLELARLLYEEAEWDGVVYLCRQALAITDRPQTYICEAEAWGSLPWDLLSLGLYHTGRRGEALEAARQALALSPEDGRIRDNVAFLAG
ncbi:MAG: glycosyl transferase family 2, partial [Flavonifractor sp.]|nr:glycosyl transferase family 2 [Flavonifractor sp.]